MQQLFLITIGGALGTLARYGAGSFMMRLFERGWLPYGTLAVNLLGCFLIGYVQGKLVSHWTIHPHLERMIFIGFLGGFTTFSAYGWETTRMMHDGHYIRAAVYVIVSNVLGIGLAIAGYWMSRAPLT